MRVKLLDCHETGTARYGFLRDLCESSILLIALKRPAYCPAPQSRHCQLNMLLKKFEQHLSLRPFKRLRQNLNPASIGIRGSHFPFSPPSGRIAMELLHHAFAKTRNYTEVKCLID